MASRPNLYPKSTVPRRIVSLAPPLEQSCSPRAGCLLAGRRVLTSWRQKEALKCLPRDFEDMSLDHVARAVVRPFLVAYARCCSRRRGHARRFRTTSASVREAWAKSRAGETTRAPAVIASYPPRGHGGDAEVQARPKITCWAQDPQSDAVRLVVSQSTSRVAGEDLLLRASPRQPRP